MSVQVVYNPKGHVHVRLGVAGQDEHCMKQRR